MNMWIKRVAAAAGVSAGLLVSMSGQASDGTITFTGAVTANTCTVDVNATASNNATVALPTVDAAALDSTADRTTAAGTFFSMNLAACTFGPITADIGGLAPTNVRIYFEAGPNVNPVTGGLINTLTVAASNVEVRLYKASSTGTVVTTQIMPGVTGATQPDNLAIVADPAIQWFYAGYSIPGTGVAGTAGAVSTSVTYSLIYS